MDNSAVTTYSICYTYLTEKGKEDDGDTEEGTVRGSMTLGRLIIGDVDKKIGEVCALEVKCKGSDDSWIATRICSIR